MSTTIQAALIVCIVIVLAVDVLNIRKNDQLQHQINLCTDLHKRLLSMVFEQEDAITSELDDLVNDIWDNKVDKLIMQAKELDKDSDINFCPFHEQVILAYRDWQNETAAKIKRLKRKQINMTKKLETILDIDNEG